MFLKITKINRASFSKTILNIFPKSGIISRRGYIRFIWMLVIFEKMVSDVVEFLCFHHFWRNELDSKLHEPAELWKVMKKFEKLQFSNSSNLGSYHTTRFILCTSFLCFVKSCTELNLIV